METNPPRDLQLINLDYTKSTSSTTPLLDLVKLLASVELDSEQAALNETSISDNNGGRIML